MEKEERRALEIVLAEDILPVLVVKNVNFSILWRDKGLRIKMPKNIFKMLRKSDGWFSGVKAQKSILSVLKINSEDGSPKREVTISGKLYISSPDIVLILKAELKQVQ